MNTPRMDQTMVLAAGWDGVSSGRANLGLPAQRSLIRQPDNSPQLEPTGYLAGAFGARCCWMERS